MSHAFSVSTLGNLFLYLNFKLVDWMANEINENWCMQMHNLISTSKYIQILYTKVYNFNLIFIILT
jgi:hypothetical protein